MKAMFFYEYFRKCTPYEIQVRRADFMFNVCAQYSQTVSAIGGGVENSFPCIGLLPTYFLLWGVSRFYQLHGRRKIWGGHPLPSVEIWGHMFIEQHDLNFASSLNPQTYTLERITCFFKSWSHSSKVTTDIWFHFRHQAAADRMYYIYYTQR